MANGRRGEIEARIGGRRFTLCLTLGALAELETAFAVEDLQALGRRFGEGRLSARDLVRIIGAGVRGAGGTETDEEIAALPVAEGIEEFVRAAADLLVATFGSGAEGSGAPVPPRPREPQDARTGNEERPPRAPFPGTRR